MTAREQALAWDRQLQGCALPAWEALPELELYMDQVIMLLRRYLAVPLSAADIGKAITPSIVNNLVRLKVMPAPTKKKYDRRHIAYLIMICMLKQTLSTSEICALLPPDLTPEETQRVYTRFVEDHRAATALFSRFIETSLTQAADDNRTIGMTAIAAGLFANLSGYLLHSRAESSE